MIRKSIHPGLYGLGAVFWGLAIGALALLANSVEFKWKMVIIIAAIAPAFVLQIRDFHKIILTAFVVSVPLGIDFSIGNLPEHSGGPAGFIISLMTILLVAGYLKWILDRQPRPRFYPAVTLPAILYLLISLFSLYFSRDWLLSAFGLFLKLQLFLMFFYLINHIRTWEDIKLVVWVCVISLFLESGLMLMQYFFKFQIDLGGLLISDSIASDTAGIGVLGDRVSGTLGRPANAALFINAMAAIGFGAYLSNKLINQKLALGATMLGIVALVATSTRGGWIAFLVCFGVIFLRSLLTKAGKKAIILLLAGGMFIGITMGQQIYDRFPTIFSDTSREMPIAMAWNIIRAHPYGVGENNYALYMTDEYSHPGEVGHTHYTPHDKYVLDWAQLGLQGLLSFLLLLSIPLLQSLRWFMKADLPAFPVVLSTGFLAAFIAHLVQMGSESFDSGAPAQLFWMNLAFLVVVTRLALQTEPQP